MQRITKIEEKLRFLKDLLNGEKDLNFLRPPQFYCVMQQPDGLYQIPGIELLCDREMLEQWKANLRDCDKLVVFEYDGRYNEPIIDSNVVVFKEQKTYADDSSVAIETVDVEYTEVHYKPAEVEMDKKPQRKTKRRKEAVIEPQEAFRPIGLIPRNIHSGKLSEYGLTWGSICD